MPILVRFLLLFCISLQLFSSDAFAAMPLSEHFLPDSTTIFVSATDINDISSKWSDSLYGRLFEDPSMEPFLQDLKQKAEEKSRENLGELGLTWEDIFFVASGEVTVSINTRKNGLPNTSLFVDISSSKPQAQDVMGKIEKALIKKKGKRSVVKHDGTDLIVFDMPDVDLAAQQKKFFRFEKIIYFMKSDLLFVTGDIDVAKHVVDVFKLKGEAKTLSDVDGFQKVMARCKVEAKGDKPEVRWFFSPIPYFESLKVKHPNLPAQRKRAQDIDILKVAKAQGFGGVTGVGGFHHIAIKQYDIRFHVAVYTPSPLEKGAKILKFVNRPAKDHIPPAWVPNDVESCTSLFTDFLNGFDAVGSIFDEVIGEEGFFKDLIEDTALDPNGPMVHLRNDFAAVLDSRAIIISDTIKPITPESRRVLIGIKIADGKEKAFAASLKKALEDDKEYDTEKFEGVEIHFKKQAKVGQKDAAGDTIDAFAVKNGYWFIATKVSYLKKILKPLDQKDSLAVRPLYLKVVTPEANALMKDQDIAFRGYSDSRADSYATYELIRQNKLHEDNSVLAILLRYFLNAFVGVDEKDGEKKFKVNGKLLPDYKEIEGNFGPNGYSVRTEAKGWLINGFSLNPYLIKEEKEEKQPEPETKPEGEKKEPKDPEKKEEAVEEPKKEEAKKPEPAKAEEKKVAKKEAEKENK